MAWYGLRSLVWTLVVLPEIRRAVGGHRVRIVFDREGWSLHVCEICLAAGFPETDAHAFAKLYEQLASRARTAFTDLEKGSRLK